MNDLAAAQRRIEELESQVDMLMGLRRLGTADPCPLADDEIDEVVARLQLARYEGYRDKFALANDIEEDLKRWGVRVERCATTRSLLWSVRGTQRKGSAPSATLVRAAPRNQARIADWIAIGASRSALCQ